MLSPSRALSLHAESGRPLPRVPAFTDLYNQIGWNPRHGEVIMVAGRSKSQKSGFALYWVEQMGLPTLYFSADMSAFTASARLASMATGETTEDVEVGMKQGRAEYYLEALARSKIQFAFGSPITWRRVEEELEAYVELWNAYPKVIVLDNLMDFEDAESDYSEQMAVMSEVTEMARYTESTVIVMHHATDKSKAAEWLPNLPPSVQDIKNGLGEKAECTLGVALDPSDLSFSVAVLLQRMGPSDRSGNTYRKLRCEPETTRFHQHRPQYLRGA